MRSMYLGDRSGGERWKSVHEFEPVGGITLMVAEPAENPDTVNLVMLDTMEGVSVVSEIDRADPAARARAIAMGETVREALEAAALTWDIDDDGRSRQARTERA